MPAIVWVVGVLVVIVVALLAVDWFTAGRARVGCCSGPVTAASRT